MRFLQNLPTFPWKFPFLTSKSTTKTPNVQKPKQESIDETELQERLDYARAQLKGLGKKMDKLGDMDDLNIDLLKERFNKMRDRLEEPLNINTDDLKRLEQGIGNINGVLNNVKKRQQREQQPVHLRDSKTEKVDKRNEMSDGVNGNIEKDKDVTEVQNGTIKRVHQR